MGSWGTAGGRQRPFLADSLTRGQQPTNPDLQAMQPNSESIWHGPSNHHQDRDPVPPKGGFLQNFHSGSKAHRCPSILGSSPGSQQDNLNLCSSPKQLQSSTPKGIPPDPTAFWLLMSQFPAPLDSHPDLLSSLGWDWICKAGSLLPPFL